MAKKMPLDNPEALKRWLSEKPSPWSFIIAIRMALRVLPVVNQETKSPSPSSNSKTIVSVFQSYCLSWAVHRFSIRDIINTSFKSSNTMLPVIASCINVAAKSAVVGMHTVSAIESVLIFSAAQQTIQAAYPGDIDKFWKQIARDVLWLEAQAGNNAHSQATKLAEQPLWHEDAPQSLQTDWNNFKLSALALDHGFQPWIRWYEAIAPFDARTAPRDLFSEGLTRRIASQPSDWWERPALDINTDIARWLEEDTATPLSIDDLAAQLTEALDQLPGQQPAPYQFDWRDGRMEVLPPDTLPEDGGLAQDYLDETREKADDLLQHLSGSNVNPEIARKVGKLREVLTERAADLRPAVVDSRTITVERLVQRLDNPEDKAELSSRILSDLDDLAETARRLCQCLPELWRRDVEALARSLTADSAATLLANLNALRDGIKDADIIGPDVHAAFDTLSEESAEPADGELKKRRTAMFGVTAHNFLKNLLLSGKGLSRPLAEKLHQFSKDVRGQLYPELVKKTAGAIVVSVVSLPAVACLFLALSLPIEGIWRFLPGAEPVGRVIETLKPGRGETPATPPSVPPPPPPPRTARPTSEKGPTRPA